MWGAVVLWSIEMLPQIWMNARNKSTGGQAAETITISFVGKTTDFLSMVSLDLPTQFRVMTYFSTCAAYMNIIQFLYFRQFISLPIALLTLTASCSVAMAVKVGWQWACVVTATFLGVLVGGYHVENCLFRGCITPQRSGSRGQRRGGSGSSSFLSDDEEGFTAVLTTEYYHEEQEEQQEGQGGPDGVHTGLLANHQY